MDGTIWTLLNLTFLYRRLVKKFGPHETWTTLRPKGFAQFCDQFAEVVGAKSGEAVHEQIRWAMDRRDAKKSLYPGHWRTFVMNKAAALDAGFIKQSSIARDADQSDNCACS
jgi:hypothetical protein